MAEPSSSPGTPGRGASQKQPDGLQIVKGQRAGVAGIPKIPPATPGYEKKDRKVSTGMLLRDSEARYRRLFETAKDGILILDAKTGYIIDVNPFLIQLLHYSREEFLGRELWEIGLFKDIEASKKAFRELQDKKYVRYEDLPLKTKDGVPINVEFVSNVYGVNGKRVIQCNVRDITLRKHAEQSQQQLQQTQKMEAVGQLAGGVAHDFNNLLGVILGYCELMEERLDIAPPVRKMIEEIHKAGLSAKDLTRHLLAFSRREAMLPVLLDLNASVARIETMLSRIIGDDIELVSLLGRDLGTIKADESQVEQVIMNLAINSRDAMPQGGKISIATANIEIGEADEGTHPITMPGPYVMLTVSDTGIGMDKELQSRIFEPFFSTKEASKGTGLGLSTVFSIINQSGGVIGVSSEPGHGTTFSIYFPRVEEIPAVLPEKKAVPLRIGSETILLVDDADPLRELMRRFLEDCGYTVLDSGSPADALRIASEHSGPLALMITDMEMPGFSGAVLAARVATLRPETKVLYTSGYFGKSAVEEFTQAEKVAFLEKPFTLDALVRKIGEILESKEHPAS
jgi:PAS domain S-box-containing protein